MEEIQRLESNNIIKKEQHITYETKPKRILKLDIVRTFAILCVILCHTCEVMHTNNRAEDIIISLLHVVGRLGVPMFLFLSGALLLKKNIESDEDVKEFYKKNLLPLIIANTIWVVIYNVFFLLTNQKQYVNINLIIKELFFFYQVPIANMWYFPMIIGTYLGIPFISKIVKTFSLKSMSILLIAITTTNFIIPNLNILLKYFTIEIQLQSLLNLQFLGAGYGVYIVLGYYIYNKNLKKINSDWVWIIAIISFLIAVFKRFIFYTIWYDSLSLLICGTCIFILFNKIDDEQINHKVGKICTYISKISLGLFFIHYIIQTVFFKYIESMAISASLRSIILWAIVTVISILIIKIISKCKAISKYVLLIK